MRPVPFVKGLPFIGTSLSIMAAGAAPKLHLYIDKRHKELGPVFKENMGSLTGVFLADPQAARAVFSSEGKYPRHVVPEPWVIYNKMNNCNRGLFFMEGEEWLKYRHIMNRLMLMKNSSNHHVQEFVVDNFVKNMAKFSGKQICNMEYEFYRLSVTFGTLMGTAFINHMEAFRRDIDNLAFVVDSIFKTTSKLMNMPVTLAIKLNLKVWKEFTNSVNSSLIAGNVILEKMKGFVLTDGLLKDLMDEDIDPDVITGLVMDLMLAAGDTTAYTSLWSFYLLSKEPKVAEEVRSNSQLIHGVMKEALRLYPAAIFISRFLDRDLVLPNLNHQLSKGELVMLSLYTMGRLESAYSEPHKFLPERWVRQEDPNARRLRGVSEPKAWLPFAMGSRSCVGRRLAEAQLSLTISKVGGNGSRQSRVLLECTHKVALVGQLEVFLFEAVGQREQVNPFEDFATFEHFRLAQVCDKSTDTMISNFCLELVEPVDMELRMVPVPTKQIKIKLKKL